MRCVTIASIASLLLLRSLALGQDAEWEHLVSVGDAAMAKHQYSEAENAYHESLTLAQKHWKKDARISASFFKLAEACNAQSRKEEAGDYVHRSISSLDEATKAHRPKNASDELLQIEVSAASFDKAGGFFASNQQYPDAEVMYRREIAVWENYVPERKPDKPKNNEDYLRFMAQTLSDTQTKIADANDRLADLYRREGKLHDAETSYTKSEALREKRYGPDSPQVAKSVNDLAACYSQEGQYEKAEPLYKRVIGILERSEYKDGPQMATALENYALLLKRTGREVEAKPSLDRANAVRTKSSVPH